VRKKRPRREKRNENSEDCRCASTRGQAGRGGDIRDLPEKEKGKGAEKEWTRGKRTKRSKDCGTKKKKKKKKKKNRHKKLQSQTGSRASDVSARQSLGKLRLRKGIAWKKGRNGAKQKKKRKKASGCNPHRAVRKKTRSAGARTERVSPQI